MTTERASSARLARLGGRLYNTIVEKIKRAVYIPNKNVSTRRPIAS